MAFMPDKSPHEPQNSKVQNLEGLVYTKLARLIAAIGILGGIVALVAGFADENPTIVALGISALLASLTIGVLTDISMSIAKAGGSG